jgi:hypothetical protein
VKTQSLVVGPSTTRMCVSVCVCGGACVRVCWWVGVNVRVNMWVCARLSVCVYVRVHVCVWVGVDVYGVCSTVFQCSVWAIIFCLCNYNTI